MCISKVNYVWSLQTRMKVQENVCPPTIKKYLKPKIDLLCRYKVYVCYTLTDFISLRANYCAIAFLSTKLTTFMEIDETNE